MTYKKITRKQGFEIREKYINGSTQNELAEEYNVSQSVISQYVRGVICKPKNDKEKEIYERCVSSTRKKMHGYGNSRIYKIWASMKQRCQNKKNPGYKNYGGRGIELCQEWNDFVKFKEWASKNGYADNLAIDRIDNDGNYEPLNCRWVTHAVNSQNSRSAKLNESDVRKIRSMISNGTPYEKISEKFNISKQAIYNIKSNRTWTNVKKEGKKQDKLYTRYEVEKLLRKQSEYILNTRECDIMYYDLIRF